MKVDPCESFPIFGIITSHFHIKRKKKSEEGGERRLEREIT
jgi:hypothetical protein